MRYSGGLVFTVFLLASFLVAADVSAEFYRYTDSKGKTVITDDIRKLPEKYRERIEKEAADAEAEEVRLKSIEALEKAQAPASQPVSGQAEPEPVASSSTSASVASEYSALIFVAKAFGAVVAALVIFFAVGRLTDLAGFKKLGTLISLVLSGLVFMYLLGAQLKIVAESYRDIMGQVTNVQKGLQKKGDSTGKALKETDNQGRQHQAP
jgi:hypothetical protein